MAWALVNAAAAATGEGTNPSVNPGAPTGTGGILFLWATGIGTTSIEIATITGWNSIHNSGAGAVRTARLFARASDGGANDTPAVTYTGQGSIVASMARFSGGPADVTAYNTGGFKGSSIETLTDFRITTAAMSQPSVDNCLVLFCGLAANDNGGASPTLPGGSATVVNRNYNAPVENDEWHIWSYIVQTTAAAVGADAFIATASSGTPFTVSKVVSFDPASTTIAYVMPTFYQRPNTLLRM